MYMFGFGTKDVCACTTTAAAKVENTVIVTELPIGGGKHRKGKQIISHLQTSHCPPLQLSHLIGLYLPTQSTQLESLLYQEPHIHAHTCEYPPPTSGLSFALVSIVTWYAPLAVEKKKKKITRRTMGKRKDRSWDKDWNNDNKNQPILSLCTISNDIIYTILFLKPQQKGNFRPEETNKANMHIPEAAHNKLQKRFRIYLN